MPPAEASRRGDAKDAARLGVELGDECLRFLDVVQDADDPVVEALAGLGQLELARGALKQSGTEPLFHVADPLADHRRGKPHVATGGRHIARGGNAGKNFEIRNGGKGHAGALARLMKRIVDLLRQRILLPAARPVNHAAVSNLTHLPSILAQLVYVCYHFHLQPTSRGRRSDVRHRSGCA